MSYKIFLENKWLPADVYVFDKNPIYLENDWLICKNFGSFVSTILSTDRFPDFISFDHDLEPEHEKWLTNYFDYTTCYGTGWHCANWLIGYCRRHNLKFPEYAIHSRNQIGAKNIKELIDNAIGV